MTRLDFEPENQLITTIKKALADIDQLKQVQPLGPDSVRPKIVQSNKSYDIAAILDPFGSGAYRLWTIIEFVATSQTDPYATPFFRIYDMSGNLLPYSSITLLARIELTGETNGTFYQNDSQVVWQLIIERATAFQAKILMQASDTGTVTFTPDYGLLL